MRGPRRFGTNSPESTVRQAALLGALHISCLTESMTPEQSGKTDYYEYYGKVVGPILTRIRDAATKLSESYGEPLTVVRANAQSAEGVVLSGSFVYLTREAPDNASWHVSVGFENYQDL